MRIRTRSVLTAVAVSFGLYALLLLVMHGALPKEGRAVLPLVPADTVYSIGGVLPPLTSCPIGVSRDAFGSLSQLPMASPPSAFSLYRVGLQGVIDGRQVRLWVWFRELRENGECALLFSFAF